MIKFLFGILLLVIGTGLSVSSHHAFAASSADVSITANTFSTSSNSYEYRITATNNGPDAAERFIITSPLPQGTTGFITHVVSDVPQGCDNFTPTPLSLCFPSVPAGHSVFVDVSITVQDPNLHVIQHDMNVVSNTPDPNTANNHYVLTVTLPSPTLTPTPTLSPTTKEDCKNNNWEKYGIFKNQGQCVSYIEHKQK